MRKFLRKFFAKRKLLRGNMTDMELRMWCVENCHFWSGFSLSNAKALYQFITATSEELKESRK